MDQKQAQRKQPEKKAKKEEKDKEASVDLTVMERSQLIELVREYPCLYDHGHKDSSTSSCVRRWWQTSRET